MVIASISPAILHLLSVDLEIPYFWRMSAGETYMLVQILLVKIVFSAVQTHGVLWLVLSRRFGWFGMRLDLISSTVVSLFGVLKSLLNFVIVGAFMFFFGAFNFVQTVDAVYVHVDLLVVVGVHGDVECRVTVDCQHFCKVLHLDVVTGFEAVCLFTAAEKIRDCIFGALSQSLTIARHQETEKVGWLFAEARIFTSK